MELIRQDSATVRLIAAAMGAEDFTLADVGCSGGIDAGWRLFGDRLRVFAFDPALDEIRRLTAAEANPKVHYAAGFVGLPEGHPFKDAAIEPWRFDPWSRVSAQRTAELRQARSEAQSAARQEDATPEPADQQDLMQQNLWREPEVEKAQQTVVLPDFLEKSGVDLLDFVKIDVDGDDFEILCSLDRTFREKHVLGAMLEVSFHGSDNEHFNTFHNTDRFMRAHGFDLFSLTTRPYALSALPRPYQFVHPFAAQTTQGRVVQGDALYLRDFGHRRADRDLSGLSDDQLLKLGALYALFGLIDHSAGLLLHFRERLSARLDIDAALDLMTVEIQDSEPELWSDRRFSSYADYIAAFEADDPVFYGANDRRHDLEQRTRAELEGARAEQARLSRELAELRAQLAAAPPPRPVWWAALKRALRL